MSRIAAGRHVESAQLWCHYNNIVYMEYILYYYYNTLHCILRVMLLLLFIRPAHTRLYYYIGIRHYCIRAHHHVWIRFCSPPPFFIVVLIPSIMPCTHIKQAYMICRSRINRITYINFFKGTRHTREDIFNNSNNAIDSRYNSNLWKPN